MIFQMTFHQYSLYLFNYTLLYDVVICVNYYKNTNQPYCVILLWTSECAISFSSSGSASSNDACYSNIYTMKQICTNNVYIAIDFTPLKNFWSILTCFDSASIWQLCSRNPYL